MLVCLPCMHMSMHLATWPTPCTTGQIHMLVIYKAMSVLNSKGIHLQHAEGWSALISSYAPHFEDQRQ